MPKYWGSLTDEDDVLVDTNQGALVDFSKLDPSLTEPIRVPPEAMRSKGTARQWYLTEGPGKDKNKGLSIPRATNVKPVEEEWGGAPLKVPDQDVLEKAVRKYGAVAQEAKRHLPSTPEYRGGAIGAKADQQVAHLDEREAGLTLPREDEPWIEKGGFLGVQSPRLSTAIGGRANPILARGLEDPSEKRVKFPSLEELQGVANSLSGTIDEKPTTPGGFIDAAVKQTMPGRLYQAGKKFAVASGSLPKALYEYGETLFTPRAVEATKAIGDYGVELAREGIGKVRQGINADFAEDIERQRAEAKRTGETAPYKLPDTHARTMRQAKIFDTGAKVVENVAEGINTAHQAGAGLAEALITPTNLALMKAPGAIVKAAKRGGEVSSITGLGETSVAQRWREGAARAGAEHNAALAEAKTLKDAATSSAVKQAGLETPEAVEGAWGGIRNLLTSDVNPGLIPGKGWWDSPARTATTKRIKADILGTAAKTVVNEPLMHRAVGAYYTYQMAKELPQNFDRITQGGEEFFRTGDQKKLQEILPDITSAAMLFMMAKHQLGQSRGDISLPDIHRGGRLSGEAWRTKPGIAQYRQRTRMPAYDLTDAKIQKDFVKEAFIGKRVVDHGDGLYGIRQGNSLDLARVKFVKPEDVKVEVDPATGEKKAHDAWITPPAAGAPPTIHLVAKTDMGLIKHEQTHLLTDMGALTGSLRDIEKELGLEHGAIQDTASIAKLRAELVERQATAPPEAQKNIADQIGRLDKAAKGIEAFPELVERTLGTSSSYEQSIEQIYRIKNGPMPNILDVFEKAKKGDREAMAEIKDRGLGRLYTDTMILGSPEQVAKARRNQWFETAKFLLTGKKSAADVARDIAEGRFDMTGAKPPNPLYTAEEIARGKEPAAEAPPAPAPVDAVGKLREVATQNAALKKQYAEMDKAKTPVADMKPVAEALDQSERDLHRVQADAAEQMKQHEETAAKQLADLDKQIAAVDQSTNVGKLEARELKEKAETIHKELEELRGLMKKPAGPEPAPPPPVPGSPEDLRSAAEAQQDADVKKWEEAERQADEQRKSDTQEWEKQKAERLTAEKEAAGRINELRAPAPTWQDRLTELRKTRYNASDPAVADAEKSLAKVEKTAKEYEARMEARIKKLPLDLDGVAEATRLRSGLDGVRAELAARRQRLAETIERTGIKPASEPKFSMRTATGDLQRDMAPGDWWLNVADARTGPAGVIDRGKTAAQRVGIEAGKKVEGLDKKTLTKWVPGSGKRTGVLIVANPDGTPALLYELERGHVLGAWNPKITSIDETKKPTDRSREDTVDRLMVHTERGSIQRRAHAALAEQGVRRNLPHGSFTYYGRRNVDLFTPDQKSMELFRKWARKPADLVGKVTYQEGDSRAGRDLTLAEIKKGFNDLFAEQNAHSPESFAIHMAEMDRVRHQYGIDPSGKTALRYAGEEFAPTREAPDGGEGYSWDGLRPGGEGVQDGRAGGERAGSAGVEGAQPVQDVVGAPKYSSRGAEGVEKEAPVYYSKLRREIEAGQGKWRTGELLRALKAKGVKPEEMEWSRIEDLLKGKESVTKQEILDHLDQNEVKVEEKIKGGVPEWEPDGPNHWVAKFGHGRWAQIEKKKDTYIFSDPARGQNKRFHSLEEAQAYVLTHVDKHGLSVGGTKYENYTLPGGKNYRELLLTLPDATVPERKRLEEERTAQKEMFRQAERYGREHPEHADRMSEIRTEASDKLRELENQLAALENKGHGFQSQHFSEPNVLAHVRLNERTGPNGERILHVEEIQSDWHQKGRKQGYATGPTDTTGWVANVVRPKSPITGLPEYEVRDSVGNVVSTERSANSPAEAIRLASGFKDRDAVPDAPFKKTWPELALKRIVRWAADNGFDKVTWATGATQAERYDLSKQVSEVTYLRDERTGKYSVSVADLSGRNIASQTLAESALPDFLGKEVAEKIVRGDGFPAGDRHMSGAKTLSGLDLKVGGEGMKGFYDAMLPTKVQDLAKKLDPSMKVGMSKIDTGEGLVDVHSIDLTPKAREVAKQGLPLFASRQAETPEFKKWFGDSKVVDKDGKPLVVYHGTTAPEDFGKFATGRRVADDRVGSGPDPTTYLGSHFAAEPNVAGKFASGLYGERSGVPENGRVYGAWLKIRKPYESSDSAMRDEMMRGEYNAPVIEDVLYRRGDEDGARYSEDSDFRKQVNEEALELERTADSGDGAPWYELAEEMADSFKRRLVKAGHDGVVYQNEVEGGTSYIAFDPAQIKSATGNRGTFDPENPDIRFASRAAQLPPHLQAMADDLQRRRGIPGPRKRADLGEATRVTDALFDETWEMAEIERKTGWRERGYDKFPIGTNPDLIYKDEWDSPVLVAKDAKSAGTENLFIKGVGSGGSKVKLSNGQEVEVGPIILNRQTGKFEFATYVNSQGQTEYVSSLKSILSGMGKDKANRLNDFRQFQHALDLDAAGVEHGTGYTRAEMQAFVDAVRNDPRQADIVKKSEQLTAYFNSLGDYAVSKGAIDAGVWAALKKRWPHFSPMERLFEQETGGDGAGNKAGTGSPLRNIKGSKRPVVDEIWQAIDRTHRWISQVDRNMAAANLWRMQNSIEGALGGIAEPAKKKHTPLAPAQGLTPEGEIVTRRAKAQGKTLSVDEANQLGVLIEPRHDFDKSTSVVSVVVDGKVKELKVDGVVRDFLTALNRVPDAPSNSKTVRALTALATHPTSFLKWMVTGMPAFQMAQMVRDPATGTMQTRGTGGLARRVLAQPFTGRILPLVEIARDAGRAIGSAFGKAPSIDEARFQAMYQRSAGMFSNMSAHDFETKEAVFDQIRESIAHGTKAGGVIHYLKPGQLKWGHFLDNWLEIIEKGKAPFESATRKAVARQTLKAGRNDLVAGTYARENTTNFATFGSAKWIRDANRFLPFLNAGLQSSRKFYLTMTGYDPISGKRNPKAAAEVMAKAFLWQTVPTMILWALNKGDDTIEEQRKGKNGLYYNYIRTPNIPELPEAIRGKVVAQPKAFTWSTVFSTIPEAMLDALYEEKPEYLEENLIKPVRAMFNKDPHVYDAQKEVDYKPLGRVAKGLGNELKAGGLSPWINAYLGLKFNTDPFYGGKIEMEYQRKMDAPLRQGYRTGQLSKDLSQGMFSAAEKIDDTKAAEALGTNVKGAVPGPDQIAFLANQVGLRDFYNLADRAYSEGTKREMPKGEYHPAQDLLGRRRFFPPENRGTGFASETFSEIAEKAETAVSSKKQLKRTDPLMLREYIEKRDIGFATAITKLKAKIDDLQQKRAKISQMMTKDPAERKRILDDLTNQIRGFQRRVIILTNDREKKREPK